MLASTEWKDYALLDTSDGERLERWGNYILIRPDPQIIWKGYRRHPLWKKADAVYNRSSSGGGHWNANTLPPTWEIAYRDLRFTIHPTAFKHTGLFPEQAVNWDWMRGLIETAGRPVKVLNLFAYTGGATVACAASGASVCHVDASKGMVAQARDNARLSGLEEAPIRWIVDDCRKFIEREIRRGSRYDAVIMDPPSYGRGPSGEIWKLEDQISDFIALAAQTLNETPLFFLVNSYTTGLSPSVMGYILNETVSRRYGGKLVCDEIGLPVEQTGLCLPCGASARWQR